MEKKKPTLITRRQAVVSLATLATGALLRPNSTLAYSVVDSKTKFAVLGDFGTGESDEIAVATQMLQEFKQADFDFVLTVGDNIYPNGNAKYFAKHFEEPFAGLLQERVKFYGVLGNHDVEEGRKDQCNYPLFNMGGSAYYSISRGNGLIDFFMLDSTDFGVGQANWLEHGLRNSHAVWKVVALHHPLYSSGKKHGSNLKLRTILEPMLTKYQVQVVFAGHDHLYERLKLQQGIQHFVTGAGGKMRRGDIDPRSTLRAMSYDEDNSFMLIEVDERQMNFKSINEKGVVIDSGVIKQSTSLLSQARFA